MTEVHLKVLTCPMYAALPQNMQAQAFNPAPTGTRKCILATNIAETSITIPGVRYVIDTGKHKEKRHINCGEIPRSTSIRCGAKRRRVGLDTLRTEDISKSSAMQRAGRAGREVRDSQFRARWIRLRRYPFSGPGVMLSLVYGGCLSLHARRVDPGNTAYQSNGKRLTVEMFGSGHR